MDGRSICAYCGMIYGEDWCPGECDCQNKIIISPHKKDLKNWIKALTLQDILNWVLQKSTKQVER